MHILNSSRFEARLKEKGYKSLSELALSLGMHRNTLHYYLRGQPVFSHKLEKIFEALDINPLKFIVKKAGQIPDQADKLKSAISSLNHALSFEDKITDDDFYFAGIVKCFESCLEYAWRHFKHLAIDQGLESFGPRDSIKHAGHMKLIDSTEKWLDFIKDKNDAINNMENDEHISDNDYLKTIKAFLIEVKKLKL